MADPSTYRPAPGSIPTDPGVYKFRDSHGRVVYVGKAKNLRSRLSNYFQDLSVLHPRTRQMVTTASSVEWTVVGSEVEALQLEYTWIKKFDPRFNVKYRDDKTYPVLAVSVEERFPRAFFYRGPQRKGIRYFGPYSHAWAVRETLDLLTRVFPVRTCSKGVFNRHESLGRPCLLGYIDKCSAPCIGRVTEQEHRDIVNGFCSFMAGKTDAVVASLNSQMLTAAEELDFERAARLRDDLQAVQKITEQQAVVLGDGTDADVIAMSADDLEASIQLFHVRAGRVKGQRGWIVERTDNSEEELQELLQAFLIRFYSDAVQLEEETSKEEANVVRRGVDQFSYVDEHLSSYQLRGSMVPKEVLVEIAPLDMEHTKAALSHLRGSAVDLRVPARGDKRALTETVHANAMEALRQHKLKRVGDLTARSAALQELQEALFLEEAPLRIECIDISHIQGTDVVASLVVFEDGLPKKSDYRRYKIKDAAGDGHSNDVASIAEVVRRRFIRHHKDKLVVPEAEEFDGYTFSDETVEHSKRFAYPPQLFIVDGGAPQVAAADEVFEELGVNDVALVGIAKRLEELWVAQDDEPVILPRNSQAMYLIQQIRDEAHRFAITFHRQQRSKRMRASALDEIKGLGQTRRSELVKHFGSVKKLKAASVEEIAAVKGFGPRLAQNVFDALHTE
ncbi:excinuclease ABC subunit UvrC [Corynebacterium silvaticum]|uniref:UvrABC system protein C n=1 Tax=Corynebacterium silvaticum TaxID=2320431 RepID=A0A7Y4LGA5_9CORY|nr:excinuclease ABC subunit UvrC [Corynebacterium silvaticum]ARU46214.1 excinuclease ABC subunit UvrC [Corynebacterium silvaticum]MBH5299331.1 excinuclease ABC subunit UvrC [Corynebacterium silvaticum]NOM64349.1 excinuclease ABC subunit UvrC [Corynebacterium silvaticum]NON69558.1 excinuclease ABC subunit UvrC [Corynebacterium silvaticum]TFA94179.1 excinuclease ABC subunit UvrC [Corynebacterium silvaticum]